MRGEIFKAVGKNVFKNLLILFIILVLIIGVTGIPMDLDFYVDRNEYHCTKKMSEVTRSIKDNFKIFNGGKAFKIEVQSETVGHLLWKTAGKSLTLLFWGTVLSVIIGILKGILDSRKKDQVGTVKLLQSLIPLSLPDVLTISLIQLLAYYLYTKKIKFLGIGPIPSYGDESAMYAIYPVISIALLPAAYIGRVTASVIEDSFRKPYILAARGKGCSTFQIIKNHMMKSIMHNVLSAFPAIMAIMFSSLVIVEKLYLYKGMTFYLMRFYTSKLIPADQAGIAFTTFIVFLAIFYFIIYTIFNVLKQVMLPKTKSY